MGLINPRSTVRFRPPAQLFEYVAGSSAEEFAHIVFAFDQKRRSVGRAIGSVEFRPRRLLAENESRNCLRRNAAAGHAGARESRRHILMRVVFERTDKR